MTQITEIQKGDIIRYIGDDESLKHRWFSVSRVTKYTVNLGGVWGGKVIAKGISKTDVQEDSDAFYGAWSKTDEYRQM